MELAAFRVQQHQFIQPAHEIHSLNVGNLVSHSIPWYETPAGGAKHSRPSGNFMGSVS